MKLIWFIDGDVVAHVLWGLVKEMLWLIEEMMWLIERMLWFIEEMLWLIEEMLWLMFCGDSLRRCVAH